MWQTWQLAVGAAVVDGGIRCNAQDTWQQSKIPHRIAYRAYREKNIQAGVQFSKKIG
jgi:hypothetical protein